MTLVIDIGDLCTHCGRDTSFGAVDDNGERLLLFVNRLPSGADGMLVLDGGEDKTISTSINGYICVECRSVECHRCGELTIDYEILDLPIPKLLCADCYNNELA